MKNEMLVGSVGTIMGVAGTASQTNELLQTISLIITIIGGVITFIVVPLLTWYNKAKADGKITKDEINEGIDIATNGVKTLDDKLKGKDKEDNGEIHRPD